MSVYKPKNSPYYHFDFKIRGLRFHGSTGTKNRRAAQRCEDRERQAIAEGRRERPTLTLSEAFKRYYEEVAQFHATAYHADYQLANLLAGLGSVTLADIDDGDVAKYVAKRRGKVSDSTANRETALLRRVFRHAKYNWKVDVGEMPDWRRHILTEPEGRVRELSSDEEAALMRALREDFRPLVEFALLSGVRLGNCRRLTWSDVDYGEGEIRFRVKSRKPGGKLHIVPIIAAMQVLLANQRGNHPIYVFTYECKRSVPNRATGGGRVKGERYPFSQNGWRKAWAAALKDAEITDFRFHDLRHTTATRVMRATGNLKVVKELLGHADIATTDRYAHVTKDDVKRALEVTHNRNSPEAGETGTSKTTLNALADKE